MSDEQLAEAHGGRIGVESAVGQGSDFHFSIPVMTPGAADPVAV